MILDVCASLAWAGNADPPLCGLLGVCGESSVTRPEVLIISLSSLSMIFLCDLVSIASFVFDLFHGEKKEGDSTDEEDI